MQRIPAFALMFDRGCPGGWTPLVTHRQKNVNKCSLLNIRTFMQVGSGLQAKAQQRRKAR